MTGAGVSGGRFAPLPGRQVHLDFHTSPLIEDLLGEFDADALAEGMVRARVNSVTVFAKCHHGMSYYPTRVGHPHPHLGGRDLLGEMIGALHARGVAAPVYYTVGWEERLAFEKPGWRQVGRDGLHARAGDGAPGGWYFMDFLHPDYLAHMRAEVEELCRSYPVDGFFFDICFFHPDAGYSDASLAFKRRHGLSGSSADDHRFNVLAKRLLGETLTPLIAGHHPHARVFYNSAHRFSVDNGTGVRAMNAVQSHWEIESLPSGFWGYFHFPRFARHVATFGRPWLGMTGRFQNMWGDFGGIKPQAALEFECFRTQAHGGANSVGDQLPPRGRPDPAAYALIGSVYRQVEEAEPFYTDTHPLFDFGILLASHPTVPADASNLSEEGAVLMAEEAHYHPAVLDDASDLTPFGLLLLPDTTVVTPELYKKLRAFYEGGGQLVLSYRAGMDEAGRWALDFLPIEPLGEADVSPTYWRCAEAFWPEARASDRVFYDAGMQLAGGGEILVERVLPYFARTDEHFMSHLQAPPLRDPNASPAVVAGERFVYFADPVFRSYRRHGSTFHRDVVERVIHRLIGPPRVGAGLPRTVLSLPRRIADDLRLTLLHYVPLRKAVEGDVLEEPMGFGGTVLRVPGTSEVSPRIFGGEPLEGSTNEGFKLPNAKGRLLLEIPGFLT